jgi:hypothetical protein
VAKRPGKERRVRGGPTLGHKNVGVGISFGFPLLIVGAGLLLAAYQTGGALFWGAGAALLILGMILFTSGKTL